MTYEVLSHTADAKFRGEGDTLEQAFSEAVSGFSAVVYDYEEERGRGCKTYTVEANSENLEALLFDFLDRLIYLQDTEFVAVSHAESVEIDETEGGYSLNATIKADPITEEMSLLDIKGPTYNEMKIEESDSKWVVEAVLDI